MVNIANNNSAEDFAKYQSITDEQGNPVGKGQNGIDVILLNYGDTLASHKTRLQEIDDQLDDHEKGISKLSPEEVKSLRQEHTDTLGKIKSLEKPGITPMPKLKG